MRSSHDFGATVRRGRRVTAGRVTAYLDTRSGAEPAVVGLIVSRQVGNSVARHRVARVLRHAVVPFLATLPHGTTLVLRALPGAAERDAALSQDVRAAVARLSGS